MHPSPSEHNWKAEQHYMLSCMSKHGYSCERMCDSPHSANLKVSFQTIKATQGSLTSRFTLITQLNRNSFLQIMYVESSW